MSDESLSKIIQDEKNRKAQYKKSCYHEACHAVVAWNFDIEVYEVIVDPTGNSGYMQPFSGSNTRRGTIGNVLCCLAGGVAHRCYQSDMDKGTIEWSGGDLRMAVEAIRRLQTLPIGAEVYLTRYFLTKTRQMVDVPEVRAQIQLLTRHLLPTGRLLFGQIHGILRNAPTSKRAVLLSCKIVDQIEAEWKPVVTKASAMASQFAATESYKELCLLIASDRQGT